ncbi:hypothetical protein ACFLYH_00170 [Candidatus Dependentiae bacterium]
MLVENKKASILLYTLLILSLITVLTQQLIRSSWIGTIFNNSVIYREQARALALSGVNLAISQISFPKSKKDEREKIKDKPLKDFLSKVLPNINRWQIFNLKEKIDGLDGQIKFCITCENGKLNINQMFDFKKQEFKPIYKSLLKGLSIKGKIAEGEFEKNLTTFFKNRKRKLDDISELINVDGFEGLKIFYKPPENSKTKKNPEPNKNIFLQDLFTIWTEKENIQLLFASDSLSQLFGLRRPLANDAEKMKEKFDSVIKKFNKSWPSDWEKNWQNIQLIVGPCPKTFKVYKKILSKEFGPQVYSVISCGKVGNVEQKLLVVLIPSKDLQQAEENNKKENGSLRQKKTEQQEKIKKESFPAKFDIVRFYWI